MTPLLNIRDVAKLLAVSVMSVRRLVHEKGLPCIQIYDKGPLRFTLADVEKFVEKHRG